MIGFDLHEVIMELVAPMERWYKEVLGYELKHTDRFSYIAPEGYNPKRFGPDIARAIREVAPTAKPMPGSIEALTLYFDITEKPIHIVTASAPSTMDANEDFLKRNLPVPYKIYRTDYQGTKLGTIQKLELTGFVDDRFRTCNELAPHLEQVFLYNAMYNRGREPDPSVIRIDTLDDIFIHLIPH